MRCYSRKLRRRRHMHKQMIVVAGSEMTTSFRPEILNAQSLDEIKVVEKPRSLFDKLYGETLVRKGVILIALAVAWEVYGIWLNNELLFPTFGATMTAFVKGIASGVLPGRAWGSIRVLLMGYAAGVVLAAMLTGLAIASRIGRAFLDLVWVRKRKPGLRAGAFGDLGDRPEHSRRLSVREQDFENGRPKLRPDRTRIHCEDTDACSLPQHTHRSENRLGLRLANLDRGRTRIRRQLRIGRTWVVHLREQEHARHS